MHSPVFQIVTNWFKRNFSDPEAIALSFTIIIAIVLIEIFSQFLVPIIISVIIAYLLTSLVRSLERIHIPHLLAVFLVYFIFLGLYILALFGLLPLMWKQLVSLIHQLPSAFAKSQIWINDLAQHYPKILSTNPLEHLSVFLKDQSMRIGRFILSFSLSTIPSIIEIILYVVLVPLLVFFFLKDGKVIGAWFVHYLPRKRGLIQVVWSETNKKIGVYVRGRVTETFIVGIISVIVFAMLGLQYAVLLGVLVGISVIVPYIGAIVVTIPIVIIGLMQWGLTAHLAYLLLAYGLIITLDANLLVPILFSETMDLHPLVIILSVLVFGGFWGFWGVFFAIPLATLIKVILNAWPQGKLPQEDENTATFTAEKPLSESE